MIWVIEDDEQLFIVFRCSFPVHIIHRYNTNFEKTFPEKPKKKTFYPNCQIITNEFRAYTMSIYRIYTTWNLSSIFKSFFMRNSMVFFIRIIILEKLDLIYYFFRWVNKMYFSIPFQIINKRNTWLHLLNKKIYIVYAHTHTHHTNCDFETEWAKVSNSTFNKYLWLECVWAHIQTFRCGFWMNINISVNIHHWAIWIRNEIPTLGHLTKIWSVNLY